MSKENIIDVLRLEVKHTGGELVFDPTTIIMAMLDETHDIHKIQDGLTVSVITGKPGVIYKTHQAEVHVTFQELRRIVYRNLKPHEFKVLYRIHGDIHELHDDFYDPDTGEAFQPVQ